MADIDLGERVAPAPPVASPDPVHQPRGSKAADPNERRTIKTRFRALLREPLIHFLFAGLLVFAISAVRGEAVDPASRTITIDEAQVARLVASWEQTWQRPPTQGEIDGLIRDYIKEEIYYREAKRLGLDQDDTVIRRRLRSKMEFLATAEAESAQPDAATLQKWLDRDPARYQIGAEYSFDQIYLGALEPAQAKAKARTLEAELAQGQDWHRLGETIALPASLETADRGTIARAFGDEFALALAEAPRGGWTGPVTSGFGQHLVRIRAVTSARTPQLADVRQAVENDWRSATIKDREGKAYQALLDGYTIKIVKP